MESAEIMDGTRVLDASVDSCVAESLQLNHSGQGSDNLGDELLEDLDSYLEDINDRLTISRMVSNSVIKGMVNAVAQEANEKIAMKDLEVAGLKETLHFCDEDADETNPFRSPINFHEAEKTKYRSHLSASEVLAQHDRLREFLGNLKGSAEEQLKRLKIEIASMRGSSSVRRISSNSELVGLGGILQEKATEKWTDVDKTIDILTTTLDAVYEQANNIVYLSKASLSELLQDWEFQGEVEAMVIKNSIRSLQEEFEERLWEQNAHCYGNGSVHWLEKMKEISRLRQELDAISKMLCIPESAQLTSHGSCEIGEERNNVKRTDHLHRKVLSNHVSSVPSLWEGNGKHEGSKTIMPENLESSALKHMSNDELFNYFKTEMTKMKRNHESQVQEMTEELFSLKREFLKERGSSSLLKKDKEFDAVRKKIPGVILKLDDILVENEKFPVFTNKAESLESLKDRLDTLLSENHQLRDSLTDKKKEIKCLLTQVSDATEKMSLHSLTEAKLLKMIGNLECAVEDAKIEASISEDVYSCILREASHEIKCETERSSMEFTLLQEIYEAIFREAAHEAETIGKCEIKDPDIELIIMQGLCADIYREMIKDVEEKINVLNMKYNNEKETRVFLEIKALEKEKAFSLEVEEKEKLKQRTLLLEESLKEKEKFAQEVSDALVEEKEQLKLASLELNNLRDHVRQQQILISQISEAENKTKDNLVEVLGQIDRCKGEICELKQKLELARKELGEADEQKRILLAVVHKKQNTLSLIEAKEREHNKQMQSVINFMNASSKAVAEFERRLEKDIRKINLRLESANSQLTPLVQKANIIRRTGLRYKQRLERRYSDLQKAESEVDLLGDEVDVLLGLLEKIYIALDHYSPILQHYPGIIEILKLIRRELSGESTKPA